MAESSEVRDFLTSRRGRVTPDVVGLPAWDGTRRRVPGLRREEVAALAGVSADYYKRLERGNLEGVSDSVLEAIANALHLSDAERDHLYDLAEAANPTPRHRRPIGSVRIRDSVRYLLDSITAAPAFIRNERRDILAANHLGQALYAPMYTDTARPPNTARFIFLDPAAREFYLDWDRAATNVVAVLRTAAGRRGHDQALLALVTELSDRSQEFTDRWTAHEVHHHYAGRKRYRHPVVGDIELLFEAMPIRPDQGLTLMVYPAAPGSAAEESLQILASWTVHTRSETAPTTDTVRHPD